jgi:HEAT repeat protein
MRFYDHSKEERKKIVKKINDSILKEIRSGKYKKIIQYFSDEDTYIRKTAYLAVGKIYKTHKDLHAEILKMLDLLLKSDHSHIRQTSVNAAGEIGMTDFSPIEQMMNTSLFDKHHSVRNAVIGSLKKMGEKNPKPVLQFAKPFLYHEDKEIRREICHGIELRGRTHPQDILPLLKELQFDQTSRVYKTLVHVLGQISYKKGCLEIVLEDLKTWTNKALVNDAVEEIIDVHYRYRNFAAMTQAQAKEYINRNM